MLGSGLGGVAQRLNRTESISFLDIPGLAAPSVPGHHGSLTLGEWAGRRLLVLEGRLHFYEGHPWCRVVEPVRIAAFLGAKTLLVTNAAGGIRADLVPGSLMAIGDHIEWTRPNCWRPTGPPGPGPAPSSPYSGRLLGMLHQAARTLNMKLHQGVYAAVTGPNYETPAEIRALRYWGADAVGMSTIPEIQMGNELGLECAALSCITNRAAGLSPGPINHPEVLTTAAAASHRLADLIEQVLYLL